MTPEPTDVPDQPPRPPVMSPGQYLRRRRKAAGVSIELIALATETANPPVCARRRAEWLEDIEADGSVISADVVEMLAVAFDFDRHVLYQLIAIHAGAKIEPPQLCRACGCSWMDPCFDQDEGTCDSVSGDLGLCTRCALAGADGTGGTPVLPAPPATHGLPRFGPGWSAAA